MNEYWLSFAGKDKPYGAAIVREKSPAAALRRTTLLGINPGGECGIINIDEMGRAKENCADLPRDVLMSPEELTAKGFPQLGEKSSEFAKAIVSHPAFTDIKNQADLN